MAGVHDFTPHLYQHNSPLKPTSRKPPFTLGPYNFRHPPGALSRHGARRSLILSARGSIRVADAAHLDGQLLAGGSVHIDGDASITYPSLVFAEGKTDEEDETGGIRLIGRARVDGTLVVPPEDGEADDPYLQDARIILIDEDAVLRGALYSGARAEIRGGVIGSVVASSLYFYESPRHYVNWLKDAVIDRSRRPKDLAVPTGFVDSRRYVLMDQTEQSTRGDILKTDRAPI